MRASKSDGAKRYITQDPVEGTWKCSMCDGRDYSLSGGFANIVRHFETKHPAVGVKFIRLRKQRRALNELRLVSNSLRHKVGIGGS